MLNFYFLLALFIGIIIGAFSALLLVRGDGWFISLGNWSSRSGNFFIRTRQYKFRLGNWYPLVRVQLRYWENVDTYHLILAKDLKDLRDLQLTERLVKHSPYVHGMYNGLEMALALIEKREASFTKPITTSFCTFGS
jgi:hypothetical protein